MKKKAREIMDGTPVHAPVWTALLHLLSRAYGFSVALRNTLYDRRLMPVKKLPCRVISIGNLCVGGTGKTPMTIYTADVLRQSGSSVCIISRGYKGRAERAGGVVADGKRLIMDADHAGDEPYMMARRLENVPVLVGKDRYAAGMKAVSLFHPDVVLLDDGYQHRRLCRDLDVVLLDYTRPLGNGYLLPRGRLREPAAHLSRGGAVVFTRTPEDQTDHLQDPTAVIGNRFTGPVFFACHKPKVSIRNKSGAEFDAAAPVVWSEDGREHLMGRRVFAFAGIADNRDFFNTIEDLGGHITGCAPFDDHHRYTAEEIEGILLQAKTSGANVLATTEKDAVRLPPGVPWPMDFAVVGIDIVFSGPQNADAFRELLLGHGGA